MTAIVFRAGRRFRTWLLTQRNGVQWLILLVLSAVFVAVFESLHLPAALLLGPMIAGILLAIADTTVRIPRLLLQCAQAIVGCLIARSLPASVFSEMMRDWPLFIVVIIAVIGMSNLLGWLLAWWRVLPGTTALWGASPGAASAMTLMSESYGADMRLVALMQYLRVVFVVATASIMSRLLMLQEGAVSPERLWLPPVAWLSLAETLVLAAAGVLAGRLSRIPAAPMMVPLLLGMLLQDTGLVQIELPPWLLLTCYALLGWTVGLRFSHEIIANAARAMPRVIATTAMLILLCGGLAALLVVFAGIDPLTAYLATSPGGADSVAIIAAGSDVNLPFVMAMQAGRMLVVIIAGPAITRLLARHVERRLKPAP